MVADALSTCVAAAVCQTGGLIVIRLGAKVVISNVQARIEIQLDHTGNILGSHALYIQ